MEANGYADGNISGLHMTKAGYAALGTYVANAMEYFGRP